MPRNIRPREVLLGFEGLALMRQLYEGDDRAAQARVEEIRRIVSPELEAQFGAGFPVPELGVREGYTAWSATYDRPGNPLIAAEQPAVWSLLDELEPGRALDAACGTGRHTARLVELGHQVIGVDLTPAMLERARAAVPEAEFREGDLTRLPVETGGVDLTLCALAMDHLPDLDAPLGELARVTRPGGMVIVSDIHPVLSSLGLAAFFRGADGSSAFIRNHRHLHGEYLDAYASVGLRVRRCLEPRYLPGHLPMESIGMAQIPEATTAAFEGLPAALVWELERP
jgi:SAM-dependent methyltransferase